MSLRARLAAVGIAAIVVEATLGTALLLSAGPTRIALYLLLCAVATAVVMAVVWMLLDDPGDDGGGGGSGNDPPPPPWWPEFERDFRRYARERAPRAPLG
jgi:hypothetical protein